MSEAPTRKSSTARDMAISLIVLFIPLLVIVGLFRLRGGEDPVVVDPRAEIGQAQAAGRFPVAVPDGLDAQWRPVRADFANKDGIAMLRVGYLTPDDGSVQLVQTNEDPAALLPRELGADAQPLPAVRVDGTQWQAYRIRGNQEALVLTTGDRTVLIQGAAAQDELIELATAVS